MIGSGYDRNQSVDLKQYAQRNRTPANHANLSPAKTQFASRKFSLPIVCFLGADGHVDDD